MNNMSIIELYQLKWKCKKEQNWSLLEDVKIAIEEKERLLFEDTSATGGPSVGGMNAVVSAQPSGLAGATIGTNWASGGGTEGSGDISVPYNPSGANRVFQQMASKEMGMEHGPRTGKKSRKKRISMKSLKDIFTKRQDFMAGQEEVKSPGKVMNFDNYVKNDFQRIKR